MIEETAIIGSSKNFWLYSSVKGFDLTHPATPESPAVLPQVPLECTTSRVTIDPAKSALVVIDMQNFFLSPCLGRPRDSKGIKASDKLLRHAIPACRKAGIRIVWLNWGLTEKDIEDMPPATLRSFGFSTSCRGQNQRSKPVTWKDPTIYKGLGSELGPIVIEDGSTANGGRVLMRDQWNSALYPPLEEARQQTLGGKSEFEDVCIHKNRMSGMWGSETPCTRYLESMGIRTLLFAGVNTDQCVLGTLQDAFTKGFDCLLLSDGCATTNPAFAQECVEFNTGKIMGFNLLCENLAEGVEKTLT